MDVVLTIMAVIGAIFVVGFLAAIIVAVRFFLQAKRALEEGKMQFVRGHRGTGFRTASNHPFHSADTINADQSSWSSSYADSAPPSDTCQSGEVGSSWDSGSSDSGGSDCGSSDSGGGSSSD